jgi:transcriptional antiterminator RfaH
VSRHVRTAVPLEPPDLTPAVGEAWWVCHTRPRCEKKLAEFLLAERIHHYLPLVPSVRRYGSRTKRFTKPLFAGYVFVRFAPDQRPRLGQQDLLARVLPVEDEPRFLRQLEDVQRIVASGLEATLHPLLKRGTPVRVTGGPLRGLEGTVDDSSHPRGIVLSVDVLQQGLLVKVPLEDLKILPR